MKTCNWHNSEAIILFVEDIVNRNESMSSEVLYGKCKSCLTFRMPLDKWDYCSKGKCQKLKPYIEQEHHRRFILKNRLYTVTPKGKQILRNIENEGTER